MATRFADRAFLSLNGAYLQDVLTFSSRRNFNSRPVKGMTQDGFNSGFVEGNTDIEIDLTIPVENQLARPKIESIDYENNSVALNIVIGADQYVATNLYRRTCEDTAPGVGEEAKGVFALGALGWKDSIGNSALFDTNLSLAATG
jgi:hypothetical protein